MMSVSAEGEHPGTTSVAVAVGGGVETGVVVGLDTAVGVALGSAVSAAGAVAVGSTSCTRSQAVRAAAAASSPRVTAAASMEAPRKWLTPFRALTFYTRKAARLSGKVQHFCTAFPHTVRNVTSLPPHPPSAKVSAT